MMTVTLHGQTNTSWCRNTVVCSFTHPWRTQICTAREGSAADIIRLFLLKNPPRVLRGRVTKSTIIRKTIYT